MWKRAIRLVISLAAAGLGLAAGQRSLDLELEDQRGVVQRGFIYEKAPFPSCHASTLAEGKEGLIAAWFGGSDEGEPDVGIWVSRHNGQRWLTPVQVAVGLMPDGTTRYPCWNPVLFQPRDGPLLLFYKVGPSPSSWWGMIMTSSDGGLTWSPPRRLPNGNLGPIKNKPIQLKNGDILCGSSTEHQGWRVHLEWTSDLGFTWRQTPPLHSTNQFAAIQPTLLPWPSGRIQLLNRTQHEKISECWSRLDQSGWRRMEFTDLPNPNSGLDAVLLRDGRALLVYNHSRDARSPLNVALSRNGRRWHASLVLEREPGEYSYPAVIQTRDGLVHITYTWKRQRIQHVVLDPSRLVERPMRHGQWPEQNR